MPTYKIVIPGIEKPRVVQASTPAGARQHVAKDFTVDKIEASDAFGLAAQGVTLEVAGEAPPAPPEGQQQDGGGE